MLTADLVQARVRGGVVMLRYIDVADPALLGEAEALIALFRRHLGRTRGELDNAIADHIGDATDFQVRRGWVKLLFDRATLGVEAPRPPTEIRQAVFAEAAQSWPVAPEERPRVLARAAASLGLDPAEVEEALYADLKTAERLTAADLPEPRALLERYNLGLAQAVLLRARRVVVRLGGLAPARARKLFGIVKFHGLMHRATRTADGWELTLDGPLSLIRQTQRYGLQLALFFPALCHVPRWSLEAEVAWGKAREPCRFLVDAETGLVTHRPDKGMWTSDEERHLRASWKATETPWALRRSTRIIDLDGRGVLVPDYLIRHPDGRTAFLEIVWFWRRRTFERRLELLREAGPANLIVALATRMNADRDEPGGGTLPFAVYPFKGVISPARVIAIAEGIAVAP